MEEWKKFKNIEVSNKGKIKSKRNPNGYTGYNHHSGYKYIGVMHNGKIKQYAVHRLVCHLFGTLNIEDKTIHVNHKDFDKSNNAIENLEIVTQTLNNQKKKIYKSGKLWGVYKNTMSSPINPWISCVSIKGKSTYFGSYKTEMEAHINSLKEYNKCYGEYPFCECEYCKNLY